MALISGDVDNYSQSDCHSDSDSCVPEVMVSASLKQQTMDRHVTHCLRVNLSLLFLPHAACFEEKLQIPILQSLVVSDLVSNL